jgi:flavin-binding protein dodecin
MVRAYLAPWVEAGGSLVEPSGQAVYGRSTVCNDAWMNGSNMTSHTYRVTEIVGTSPEGVDAAIRNGLERASKTLRNIDWFEVVSTRGHLEDGTVHHFQVTMKLGFRLEDTD